MSHSLAQGKTDWRQVRLALCLRKRPRRMGWRDVLRFSIRICPQRVEPFEGRPDIFLPGTLHHSGNKPAPPSDHIPLVRRSAFWPGTKQSAWRFSGTRRSLAAPNARYPTVELFSFIRIGGRAGDFP